MIVTDPRDSSSCWSRAEAGTPDAIIHVLWCQRGRHRWGRHRNDHVTWKCPKRCGCVRHAKGPRKPPSTEVAAMEAALRGRPDATGETT